MMSTTVDTHFENQAPSHSVRGSQEELQVKARLQQGLLALVVTTISAGIFFTSFDQIINLLANAWGGFGMWVMHRSLNTWVTRLTVIHLFTMMWATWGLACYFQASIAAVGRGEADIPFRRKDKVTLAVIGLIMLALFGGTVVLDIIFERDISRSFEFLGFVGIVLLVVISCAVLSHDLQLGETKHQDCFDEMLIVYGAYLILPMAYGFAAGGRNSFTGALLAGVLAMAAFFIPIVGKAYTRRAQVSSSTAKT